MTYWKLSFILGFVPVTVIIYNILPQKLRSKWLLLISCIFFYMISQQLIVYIIATIVLIYFGGIWISKIQDKRNTLLKDAQKEEKKQIKAKYLKKQRIAVTILSLIILSILIVLKYTGFLLENVQAIIGMLKIPINIEIPKFLMPIGISFYTLQAISYLIDVYKEKIKADRNFGRLALFLMFFPQIMEGPICRYSQTAEQLWKGERTSYKNLTFGAQRILFGLSKKYLVVDRVNGFILTIFNNYGDYNGGIIAFSAIMYTLQLYMDFSGTMDIAIGIAEMFGVKMPENFKQPFFSKSISDFWTRWHITLGLWFRDYIFYPVSLTNKCKKITTKARKKIGNYYGPLISSSIALFCVWICNGLWHGSAWSYIFFGMYHFTLIILAKIFDPLFKKVQSKLHINTSNKTYALFQIVRTSILVCIGELFFRANTLTDGLNMFGKMITQMSLKSFTDGTLTSIIDGKDLCLIGILVIFIFVISLLKEKDINIRESIASKNIVLRWSLYYILIITIVVFGTYGIGYVPLDPMYANF